MKHNSIVLSVYQLSSPQVSLKFLVDIHAYQMSDWQECVVLDCQLERLLRLVAQRMNMTVCKIRQHIVYADCRQPHHGGIDGTAHVKIAIFLEVRFIIA